MVVFENPPVPQLLSNSLNLRNRKVNYCARNSPPLVPILSQINPVHATIIS